MVNHPRVIPSWQEFEKMEPRPTGTLTSRIVQDARAARAGGGWHGDLRGPPVEAPQQPRRPAASQRSARSPKQPARERQHLRHGQEGQEEERPTGGDADAPCDDDDDFLEQRALDLQRTEGLLTSAEDDARAVLRDVAKVLRMCKDSAVAADDLPSDALSARIDEAIAFAGLRATSVLRKNQRSANPRARHASTLLTPQERAEYRRDVLRQEMALGAVHDLSATRRALLAARFDVAQRRTALEHAGARPATDTAARGAVDDPVTMVQGRYNAETHPVSAPVAFADLSLAELRAAAQQKENPAQQGNEKRNKGGKKKACKQQDGDWTSAFETRVDKVFRDDARDSQPCTIRHHAVISAPRASVWALLCSLDFAFWGGVQASPVESHVTGGRAISLYYTNLATTEIFSAVCDASEMKLVMERTASDSDACRGLSHSITVSSSREADESTVDWRTVIIEPRDSTVAPQLEKSVDSAFADLSSAAIEQAMASHAPFLGIVGSDLRAEQQREHRERDERARKELEERRAAHERESEEGRFAMPFEGITKVDVVKASAEESKAARQARITQRLQARRKQRDADNTGFDEEVEKRVDALFAAFDRDGSGGLDPAEFQFVLRKMDPSKSEKDVEATFATLDLDSNRRLSLAEFRSAFRAIHAKTNDAGLHGHLRFFEAACGSSAPLLSS